MISTLSVVAPPAPVPEAHAPARPAAPHSFASMLRLNQAEPQAAEAAVAKDISPSAIEASPEDASPPTLSARLRLREGSKLPSGKTAAPAADKADADHATGLAADAEAAPDSGAGDDPATAALPPVHGLIDPHRPRAAPAGASLDEAKGRGKPAPGSTDAAALDDAIGATGAADDRARRGTVGHRAAHDDSGAENRSRREAAADPRTEAAAVSAIDVSGRDASKELGALIGTKAGPTLAATAFSAGPFSALTAAAPAEATVATPVHAPDFAQALGLQVSLLVEGGIQHAELHLNPADMGPVSVQIVVDGTQARVDFGADVAATRQAIEAGLPELASALRDAGMTLHGGGVSQHARQHGRDRHGAEPANASAAGARHRERQDGGTLVSAAPRRIALPGGIDLYA